MGSYSITQIRIDHYLKLGKDATLDRLRNDSYYSLIEDTITEMESWACFTEPRRKQTRNKPLGLGKLNRSTQKKSSNPAKKKTKKKMQKHARRQNRSKQK